MEEVFEHYIPPLRRFPQYTWRKLLHDTRYITMRHADGTVVSSIFFSLAGEVGKAIAITFEHIYIFKYV